MEILIETGLFKKIKTKFLPKNTCVNQETTEAKPLGIKAVQGIFYVLVGALILCSLVLFIEKIHYKFKHRKVTPLNDDNELSDKLAQNTSGTQQGIEYNKTDLPLVDD